MREWIRRWVRRRRPLDLPDLWDIGCCSVCDLSDEEIEHRFAVIAIAHNGLIRAGFYGPQEES